MKDAVAKLSLEADELVRENCGPIGLVICMVLYHHINNRFLKRLLKATMVDQVERLSFLPILPETSLTIDGVVYIVDPRFLQTKKFTIKNQS